MLVCCCHSPRANSRSIIYFEKAVAFKIWFRAIVISSDAPTPIRPVNFSFGLNTLNFLSFWLVLAEINVRMEKQIAKPTSTQYRVFILRDSYSHT